MSNNVYNDKLYGIVNKCNNKYYSTIKIKPVDVKGSIYNKKILNLKLVIMLEY